MHRAHLCIAVFSENRRSADKFTVLATACGSTPTVPYEITFRGLPPEVGGRSVVQLSQKLRSSPALRSALGVCGEPSVGALGSLQPVTDHHAPVQSGAQV